MFVSGSDYSESEQFFRVSSDKKPDLLAFPNTTILQFEIDMTKIRVWPKYRSCLLWNIHFFFTISLWNKSKHKIKFHMDCFFLFTTEPFYVESELKKESQVKSNIKS